jgi:transposase-like protein
VVVAAGVTFGGHREILGFDAGDSEDGTFWTAPMSSGCFPTPDALLRVAGAVLVETRDEWQVGERRYLSEGSIALLARPAADAKEVAIPVLPTA